MPIFQTVLQQSAWSQQLPLELLYIKSIHDALSKDTKINKARNKHREININQKLSPERTNLNNNLLKNIIYFNYPSSHFYNSLLKTTKDASLQAQYNYVNNLTMRNNKSDNDVSLSSYKNHPLFYYLKNNNTLKENDVIRLRNINNDNDVNDVATLILKPVARAVAGDDGRAIATPLSRAILRKGVDADILFEPESVAIAGPGGIAHAQSDLEISYEEY